MQTSIITYCPQNSVSSINKHLFHIACSALPRPKSVYGNAGKKNSELKGLTKDARSHPLGIHMEIQRAEPPRDRVMWKSRFTVFLNSFCKPSFGACLRLVAPHHYLYVPSIKIALQQVLTRLESTRGSVGHVKRRQQNRRLWHDEVEKLTTQYRYIGWRQRCCKRQAACESMCRNATFWWHAAVCVRLRWHHSLALEVATSEKKLVVTFLKIGQGENKIWSASLPHHFHLVFIYLAAYGVVGGSKKKKVNSRSFTSPCPNPEFHLSTRGACLH